MTITDALLQFALVAGLLTVIPGLDTALVLRSTLARSRRYGLAAAGGIQAGTLVWGAAAASGAAALLAAGQTAYRVLTILGAGYMIWLGGSMIWQTFKPNRDGGPEVPALPSEPHVGRGFAMGLATNLMNPKVGVFYVATIPQFVPDGVSPLLMGVLLAAVHCAMGTLWSCTIVVGSGFFRDRLGRSAAMRWIDRLTGGVLIAFGARLALSPRG